MSQVAISGNASGTGTLTIAAPNTNSNYTLTLPQATTTLVGTDATQTLTNKTLTSPTITGAVVSSMASSVITSGTAVASTSGTSINFTSIPSWVKKITVMFQGVSTSGTSFTQIQLGTGSTTYTTSGYVGGAYNGGGTAFSAGFIFSQAGSAVDTRSGIATITNITGNAWAISGAVGVGGGGGSLFGGAITLSATLTAVRITTVNGTDTFDAGTINILYE